YLGIRAPDEVSAATMRYYPLEQKSADDGATGPQLTYIATMPGRYKLDFDADDPDAYAFTVTVDRHAQTGNEALGARTIGAALEIGPAPGTRQYGDPRAGERYFKVALSYGDVMSVAWVSDDEEAGDNYLGVHAPAETDDTRHYYGIKQSSVPAGGHAT